MRYSALASLEDSFLNTGNNGEYSFKKIAIPVKGENLTLEAMLATPKNRSKYYYDVAHPKERIVVHFTAGNIRSDMAALTRNDYHVSVPFVIGRNGTIYQLFSSKHWSGHIGKGIGNMGTGNQQDKVSIGIELSNYGFLTERDGNLETYYSRQKDSNGKTGPADVYCSVEETDAYIKTDQPFRQQKYYAAYTPQQYEALIILLRYLTAQYAIPRQFMPEAKRFAATEDVLLFKGIVTHVNYRTDGKWDIGPGFDWQKVIGGVQAVSFKPQFAQGGGSRGGGSWRPGDLHSEDALGEFLPEAKDASHENDPYEEGPAVERD
ncbi:N-acetylmuramoyl-L-alanine amidase [Foetidibacter luteolus]|uniref:N-acetylmuramoyl-L-alanine amidase n=1 Tax=Foetidibacter luteolus TaxID=2608880 RepID=UPI00129A2F15|nr:N-acetylmuramoyl-L-alanine amidase [Foetidibacter luteolus]